MKQVIWEIQTVDGPVTSILNSVTPLSLAEWNERIEQSIARALPEGSYPVKVDFGTIQEHKWTAAVTKQCQIIPF
jgi:hypothetical protein